MPQYYYRCDNCNHEFSIRHSLTQRLDDCPKCEVEGALTRMPSPIAVKQAHEKERTDFEEGEIVKETIKDNKEFISSQKEELSKRVWEPKK